MNLCVFMWYELNDEFLLGGKNERVWRVIYHTRIFIAMALPATVTINIQIHNFI